MGGSSSTHGGISITFENSSCFTGQEVHGTINISVTSATSKGTLYLRFKGVEQTAWITRGNRRNNHHNANHKFSNVSYLIYQFDHGLEQGGYTLPFSFKLPENIPSSFSFIEGDKKALVVYKFYARFEGISGEIIKGKEVINLRQTKYTIQRDLTQKKKSVLKTWCCTSKGSCEIVVSYPQDTFNPFEKASFYVTVDNSLSKLPITGLTCNFGMTLRLKENGFGTLLIKKKLITKNLPLSIAPGNFGKSEPMEFNIDIREAGNEIFSIFSIKGYLIECMFTVEIEAETTGSLMCCGDYVKIISPINIIPELNYVPPPPPLPPVPENWSPNVLAPVSLAYDANDDPLSKLSNNPGMITRLVN